MQTISYNDLKIPLIIGVSGHRDIPKESIHQIESKVIEIFDNLITKYPATPFVLLSPLADGADRVVARVVLERYKNRVSVSVPLPMDINVYKDTFGKGGTLLNPEESKAEFDELFTKINAQTDVYIPKIIPMLFDVKEYSAAPEQRQRKIRHQQYSLVGEYIALHSHILLAIYNENSKLIDGGTKEIVQKKLSGNYEYFLVDNEDVTYKEQGIVYAISTPRIKRDEDVKKPQVPYQIKKIFPDYQEEIGLTKQNHTLSLIDKMKNYLIGKSCIIYEHNNSFSIQHQKINCFNSDVENHYGEILKKAKDDVISKDGSKVTNDKLLQKNIIMRRSAAYLADRVYKPLQSIKEKYILMFISLIVFVLAVKSNVSDFSFNMYIDSIYMLLLIPLSLLILEFNYIKKKQEDYRSLAEGLRVQIAWNIAEINESVALYYLSHQRSELDWIRTAIRCANIFYIPTPNDECANSTLVKEVWIEEQIEYFKKAIPREEKLENRNNLLIKIFFGIFLFGSAMFFILSFYPQINNMQHYIGNLTLFDILQILLIVFPITATAYLKSKQLFDGNDEKLREYRLSLDIFRHAKKMIDNQNKKYNIQNTIRNLGIEALRENSSWIITRRTKEYQAPTN